MPDERAPGRAKPIAEFSTHEKPVRVYAPTSSTPYFMVGWYRPGPDGERMRTSVGKVEADALEWASKAADDLKAIQQTPMAERKFAPLGDLLDAYLDPANHVRWTQKRSELKAREIARRFITDDLRAVSMHKVGTADFQLILSTARRSDPSDPRPLRQAYLQDLRAFLVAVGRFAEAEHYAILGQFSHTYVMPVTYEATVTEDVRASLSHNEDDEDREGFQIWQHQLPSWDDVRRLADAMPDSRQRLMVLLAASSGLRFGELAALKWSDIRTRSRLVRVRRKISEANSGERWLEAPKGRKTRDSCYPAWLAADMEAAVEAARLEQEAALEADPEADLAEIGLLFPAPNGGWMRRSNHNRRTWKPAHTAAGWRKGMTFHTLRHVAAIYLIYELDLDLIDVAEILGHADVSVTQRIYCQARVGAVARIVEGTSSPDAPWAAPVAPDGQ